MAYENYEQMVSRARAEQDQRNRELSKDPRYQKQVKRLNESQNIYDKLNPHKGNKKESR